MQNLELLDKVLKYKLILVNVFDVGNSIAKRLPDNTVSKVIPLRL